MALESLTPHALLLLQAASTIVTWRALLCLLALPLLYEALGEDGQGWGGKPLDVARRAFFALLGAAVLFGLTARWEPQEQRGEPGRGFQAFSTAIVQYRLSYTHIAEMGPVEGEGADARARAINKLKEAAEAFPQSAYIARYLGIVLAERGDYEAARKSLAASVKVLAERAPQRAQAERRVWESLFGPEEPTRRAVEAARRRIDAFGLGWIGDVALVAAYRRLGPEAVPPELRRQVIDASYRWAQSTFLAGLFIVLLIPQLGLTLLIAGRVLIRTGVLRAVTRELHPVSPILWEAFILHFALGQLPGLIAFRGHRPAPETQPGLVAVYIVIADVAQLFAIGYLWLRLRGRGLSLAEIGLSSRHLWANIGVGVAAAMVIMPSAVVINMITQALTDRFFPNVAPPYHPLGIMTATSTSGEIRLALFLVATAGAALLEEVFFRGCLFGAIERRRGYWPAILGSAAFFAVLHPQLPLGFLPIAVMGGAFAALYHWRQSLVPGIVAHAINNGLIFVIMTLYFPIRG